MTSIRLAAAVSLAAFSSAAAQPPTPLPSRAAPPAAPAAPATQESAKRGFLGVFTVTTDPTSARIEQLDPQGSAAKAGLKIGDVIVKIDGQPLSEQSNLMALMQAKRAGQEVTLSLRNPDGSFAERKVKLGDRPMPGDVRGYPRFDDRDLDRQRAMIDDMVQQTQFGQPPLGPRPMLGVTVVEIVPELREQLKLGTVNGAVISSVRPGTPAADAKLQPNDVVTAIDATVVGSAADLQKVIGAAKPDSKLMLKVFRDGKTIDVPVTIKSMTMPGMSGIPDMSPGFGSGRMSGGMEPFAEIRALRQRIEMLEARVSVLEGRGGTTPPAPKTKTVAPPQPKI